MTTDYEKSMTLRVINAKRLMNEIYSVCPTSEQAKREYHAKQRLLSEMLEEIGTLFVMHYPKERIEEFKNG